MFSTISNRVHQLWRQAVLALLLALILCLLTPHPGKAYAFLLRSDPASNAVLKAEPMQIRLWFSENLNPDGSTGSVVNAANQRVDVNGALVLPTDTQEMDIELRPDLPAGIYIVSWHAQSASDGQVFSGAFPFSIADTTGTMPTPATPLPEQSQFAFSHTGTTIFRWLMTALVDLSAIFWVGSKLWHSFMLAPTDWETAQQREVASTSRQRFTQRFSLPVLRMLFLANIGVLVGQALTLTANRWDLLLSPTLLIGLLTSGSFGLLWLADEVVTALAIMLETMLLFSQRHTQHATEHETVPWLDLLLSMLLLLLTLLTSSSSIDSAMPPVATQVVAGLCLLAATLWFGSLFYLALIYLPNLRNRSNTTYTLSLLAILQRLSPLAISAAIILLLSSIYNITARYTSFTQFPVTLYREVLIVQIVCIIAIFITGTSQIARLQSLASSEAEVSQNSGKETARLPNTQEHKPYTQLSLARITRALRYMSLLGVTIVLCIALTSTLLSSF
jgi:copper transport protein